jgi:hypothetical protein
MAIDKRISYDVQGGVKNYLGKQKEVTAPVKWKSSPDHPETELAYITKAEKDLLVKKDLHGSLNGGVNRGPSGIMSLNGFGSIEGGRDVGMSGAATSAAERGGGSGRDAKELSVESQRVRGGPALPPGVLDKNAQDLRSAFIAAGGGQRVNPRFFDSRNTVSPAELARARAFNPAAFKATRGGGLMNLITGGGFLGNIIRGLGQRFGLGKTYNQPTYDMSGINNTRVYENILGPSTNPNNLDIYNEFVDEEDNEEYDTQLFNFDSTGFNRNRNLDVGELVAELTNKQKRFIDSKKFPLQENLISPKSVYDTITNPDLGIYDSGTFGFGAQEPTTEEEYNDYLRSLGLTQTI